MKVTPVAQHGLKLTRLGLVNCYLILEEDGYTLVDANLKGSEEDILRAAGNTPIKRILLTHSHIDHVGAVDALAVRVTAWCSERLNAPFPYYAHRPTCPSAPGEVGEIRGKSPGIQSPVSLVIEEGDRIGSLLAISTPGHIHGHLRISR